MENPISEFFRRLALQPESDVAAAAGLRAADGASSNASASTESDAMLRRINCRLRQLILPRGSRFEYDHRDTFIYIERSKNANVVTYTARFVDAATRKPVASGEKGACILDAKYPVHAEFVVLEPSHQEEHKSKGKKNTRELNLIERKLAYGVSASPLPINKLLEEMNAQAKSSNAPPLDASQRETVTRWHTLLNPHILKFVALPSIPFLLLCLPPLPVDDAHTAHGDCPNSDDGGTTCVVIALCEGELCVGNKVYVASVEPKHFYQLPTVEYIDLHSYSIRTGAEVTSRKKH